MPKKAVVMHPEDNVAVAVVALEPGDVVRLSGRKSIKVQEGIAFGHKVATSTIAVGQKIVKYGQPIGVAKSDIAEGAHVHVHNVEGCRGRGDLAPAQAPE